MKIMNMLKKTLSYLKHYVYAFNGLKVLIKEVNFMVELLILCVLIVSKFVFNISVGVFVLWLFNWSMLVSLEALNTAIEKLADFVHSEHHNKIKDVKDVSAFGVLISALSLFVLFIVGISGYL